METGGVGGRAMTSFRGWRLRHISSGVEFKSLPLGPLNHATTKVNVTTVSTEIEPRRSLAHRWKHEELFVLGFVAVPTLFFRHYAHLQPHRLTLGEALFVLHLMEFKWNADAPFPGYSTLAKRMGVSDKMVRRYAQSLEAKKYLRRQLRTGQTNRFDLSPLFDALLRAARAEQDAINKRSKHSPAPGAEMMNWLNRMVEAQPNLTTAEQRELQEWKAAGEDRQTSDWEGWEKIIGARPKN